MTRFLHFFTAVALFVASVFGLTASAPGGSDRNPPANRATQFLSSQWLTIKFAVLNTARDLGAHLVHRVARAHAWLTANYLLAPYRLCLATEARDTQSRPGDIINYPMAAATKIYQGVLGAIDASGNAVNASDTANLRVIGRAESTVDNTSGSAGDLTINYAKGVFKFANSATNAVTAAYKDKVVFVEDNETVAISTTNKIVAGRMVAIDADGGVWVDTRHKGPINAASAQTIGAAVATTPATNSTPYGYSQAQADAIVARLNELRTAVLNIETKINGG